MCRKTSRLLLALAGLTFILSGCQKATPTLDANQIYTQAAATVQAQLTMDAALTPTIPSTPTEAATNTPAATLPDATIIISTTTVPTLEASFTPAPPTLTPTATLVPNPNLDQAVLVGETPKDYQVISPGKFFNKTWRLRNLGYTTWKTTYGLFFASGDPMGSKSPYMFPNEVKPMQDVEITIEMTAPTKEGKVRGNWSLRNDKGVEFYSVYILIVVGNPDLTSTPTVTPTP